MSRATTIAAPPVLPAGGAGQKLRRFATSRGSGDVGKVTLTIQRRQFSRFENFAYSDLCH